ncbi:Hypothetical predicted protein [Paramuricea clavata]|uniref:Uncharacterized protein n=1 Tax=Paramuricea clavata TaxID=317549 RepID=A0A6S7FRM4_PARCT|nr:Hypothetical predicted protein [Paramuricea clavata]
MKPNEGYEIGQEDLIAQLGLLILEGRKPKDVRSSLKDCINYDYDGLLHHRKEDFLSFWKSCYSMYIEVWLYRQEKFNDKEAMNGLSGYLLIEQWEIKLNSSDNGFHCTEKMLIQAIKSKLYFSQLSAWLSLTKGKFPRHTYFRLCQTENKTPLKRFIRAPDFHQFPQVSLTPTKELVVSLHSLPHSDLPLDYPMFLWVLTDLASGETPQRKIAEKLPSDFEEDLALKDECSSYDISQGKDYSASPSHVVRKLEFESVSMAGQKALDKQQCVEKDVDKTSSFETFENVNRTSLEQSICSTERELLEFSAKNQASEYVAKEKQNLISNKKGRNVSCEMSKQENKNLSLTKTHFNLSRNPKTSTSPQPQDHKLFCKEMQCSAEASISTGSFDKNPELLTSSAKSLVPKSDVKNHLPGSFSEEKEFNSSATEVHRTSPVSKEQICDQGIYEIMQNLRKDEGASPLCRKTDSNTLASGTTALGCQKKFMSMEKRCFENSRDSEIFTTGLNSKCRTHEISRKSLLTRNISAGSSEHTTLNADVLKCSHKEKKSSSKVDVDLKNCKQGYSNDRTLDDFERDSLHRQRSNSESSNDKAYCNLQGEQFISAKDRKLKNINQVSVDRQRSNSESLEARCLDHTMKKSWGIDKYGNILHRTKNEIGDILPPEVRHVIDQEYKKTFNESLRKCCLSSEGCCETEQGVCKRKVGKTEKTEKGEDNVFREQKFTAIPSRNSRYHFRHASTGTLAVFHPRTGLPVSSSPAPFRKTSQKQTVDDICSPSREPSSLSCGNLSKSAPTLTTQSLLVNFEESVLNDRLLPDGVVEGFTAELSASGSKKCLAHVTLPVQAYFFKLSDDNAPSPYMGYISLDVPGLPKKGYHVPRKGTIQLTLFNPNQTVVKVFVVLYDFSDMQPNFQTFLRQKTTSLVKSDGLVDRIHDNLHYLIHLRFASSKSGRIYLHTDIRVIFARHPPDQGHLRTATSGPTNPKYVPRHDTPGGFLISART